jgi:hypothetical protein
LDAHKVYFCSRKGATAQRNFVHRNCSVELQEDEECDATVADSSNAAGFIIAFQIINVVETKVEVSLTFISSV